MKITTLDISSTYQELTIVKNEKASFVAYCSLSTIHEKQRATEPRRTMLKQNLYDCKGTIKGSIDLEKSVMCLSYRHDDFHEHQRHANTNDPEVVEYIVLVRQKDATAIRRDVRNRFPSTAMTPNQIYYCCQQATKHTYARDEDQIESSRKLVDEYQPKGFYNVSSVAIFCPFHNLYLMPCIYRS